MKTALIAGVTGQDGADLSEFLLAKGYAVHGIKRRASLINTQRVDHLYQDLHEHQPRFVLHYGDMTDPTNLIRIVQQVQLDKLYLSNLDASRDWGYARNYVEGLEPGRNRELERSRHQKTIAE